MAVSLAVPTIPELLDGDIVTSLTDDDFYKFTMLRVIWGEPALRDAETLFAFRNRTTSVPLAQYVSEEDLNRELERAFALRFTESELRYLYGQFASETVIADEVHQRMFPLGFIHALRDLRIPKPRVIREPDDTYTVEVRGPWWQASLCEMHILQVMSELYFRAKVRKMSRFERSCVIADGQRRLLDKLLLLKRHPRITFTDFGTRRRAFRAWQEYVVRTTTEEFAGTGQYVGTSNVHLSMHLGTEPKGTCAHELTMGMSGIMHGTNNEIRASHGATLDLWEKYYGFPLSIALSDTYGSDFFLEDFRSRAARWKGTRQDSGDPFVYGRKAIAFYRALGIPPSSRLIVFSDGLDPDTMVELHRQFSGTIGVTFGWGTNFVNDMGEGLEPLSMVVKLMEVNGHKTVKLSDNIAKALGPKDQVERFKRIFGYEETYTKQPRY